MREDDGAGAVGIELTISQWTRRSFALALVTSSRRLFTYDSGVAKPWLCPKHPSSAHLDVLRPTCTIASVHTRSQSENLACQRSAAGNGLRLT